jgi:hypothetical protein
VSGPNDIKVLNVPGLLGGRAWASNDAGELVPDSGWHERLLDRLRSLYEFHRQHRLVSGRLVTAPSPLETLVIWRSDLSPAGWELWRSGAVDRWLASFDRTPGKSPDDLKMLERALAKLGGPAA